MIYPHTVELLAAATSTDAYGTSRKTRPAPDATGTASPAYMQPEQSTETQQVVADRWRVFLPAGAPLDGWGYVRWRGDLYEADGTPSPWDTPAGAHHIEAALRRIH